MRSQKIREGDNTFLSFGKALNFQRLLSLTSVCILTACAAQSDPPIEKAKPTVKVASKPLKSVLKPEHQSFSVWLKGVRKEALAKGFRASTLDAALNAAHPIRRVIELDRNQPEFKLTYDQYMRHVVPHSRVMKARRKLEENRALLEKIGKKYGVQPRFIVAFWGIETDFGRTTGTFPVINSLATLAHDGRRSAFFRKELMHALRILDEGHVTVKNMKGSWAGALGQCQFMPSSFVNFAVDEDGDGKKDLWNSKADVFASAANYLSKSGWNPSQTWGRQVLLPQGFDRNLANKTKYKLKTWSALGVTDMYGKPLPESAIRAALIFPQKVGGPAFLAYNNYFTTLKWNRSTFYALAVGHLADSLVKG